MFMPPTCEFVGCQVMRRASGSLPTMVSNQPVVLFAQVATPKAGLRRLLPMVAGVLSATGSLGLKLSFWPLAAHHEFDLRLVRVWFVQHMGGGVSPPMCGHRGWVSSDMLKRCSACAIASQSMWAQPLGESPFGLSGVA